MNLDKRLVRVWNVELLNGAKIKAATIEQAERKPSMCSGCSAPCCKGILSPVLNQEEFLSKKFDSKFTVVPDWLREKVPSATHIVTLNVTDEGCPYHKDDLCTVWDDPPKSCLAYDCREDERPFIKCFAKEREENWLGQ